MLAVIAAALFFIAFVINASGAAVEPIVSPTSLMLLGLTLVALQLAGIGPAFRTNYRRRRD
jgi:hypothetical protein